MAGKNLYEILGVATSATPEVIEAAYQVRLQKLEKLSSKEHADAMRVALNEAYKTLSNGEQRARYDRAQRGMPPQGVPQPRMTAAAEAVDDRSWLARNMVWILALVVVAISSGYFYEKQRRAKVEAQRVLEQEQARIAAERAEREAQEAERERAAAESKRKADAQREYYWSQQVRSRAAIDIQRRDRELARQEAAERSRLERERRAEEAQQRREEYAARARLEQEKRKLRQLQCANGPC